MGIFIDIKETHKSDKYTCFELMVIQLCKYWEIDFREMFAWRLSFGYCKIRIDNKECYPICFDKDYNKEFELLKKYLGFEIKSLKFGDEVFENSVLAELNNKKPVGILLDTYFCSWSEVYKKSHLHHFCLIVGYDDEHYYVCDTYVYSGVRCVPKHEINKELVKSYLLFNLIEKEKYSLFDLLKEGVLSVERYKDMNTYANFLLECQLSDVVLEEELLDIKTSSTLRIIKFYSDARTGFYELLLKYSCMLPSDMIEKFSKIKDEWLRFLYMYIHILLRSDKQKEMHEVGSVLLKILEMEQEFCNDIISFF